MNLIIITQKDNGQANIIRFNKDFDTWEVLPKKVTLPKKVMAITQKGNASLPKKVPTIETNTKETITKESSNEKSLLPTNVVIELFKNLNPSYERLFANKTERAAADRLVQKYGPERLGKIIEYAKYANTQPYAPTITTPYQLYLS